MTTSTHWIGKTVDGYLIEEAIGAGGMGVVFRGRQVSLDRPVAIKMLAPHLALETELVGRFRQEARAVAELSHEGIVGVFDMLEVEGAHFIVMEYVEGKTLSEIVAQGALSTSEVVRLGAELATALAAAHDRGIVHRDVKSQNVMLTTDGRVKLMDFGVAQMVQGGVHTRTGAVLGTPHYMAPE